MRKSALDNFFFYFLKNKGAVSILRMDSLGSASYSRISIKERKGKETEKINGLHLSKLFIENLKYHLDEFIIH